MTAGPGRRVAFGPTELQASASPRSEWLEFAREIVPALGTIQEE
jgi:hypothetical protein